MILSTERKNKVLSDLALLISTRKAEIIDANKADLELARNGDNTLYDRLKVDETKVKGMISSIDEVLSLEDPQGKLLSNYSHPNGMLVENKVVPFGNILIIYESRPDVTIEAAISAFKAGNKIFLKGGKEARNTNLILVELWHKALQENDLSIEHVTYLNIDRVETQKLLRENSLDIDLIIPRGGEALISYIQQNTTVPLLVSGRGNNFVYVHGDADFEMATSIILDGKSRLSVCNAIDKVLFNSNTPELGMKINGLLEALLTKEIEVFGDGEFFKQFSQVKPMENILMYFEEFLSAKLLFGLTSSLEDAIYKINSFSGGHSSVIVSSNIEAAATFQDEVDSAAVYHNASSRFTDGGQFGFGAEIAISTQKLHFRGPVGLAQLVTNKWYVSGNGETRG